MKTTWLVTATIAAGLMLAGCGGGYGYGNGYYARTAPPPARVEVRGYAPGPGYVWLDGYWGYRGNSYAWTPGYWARPPRSRHTWEAGRWENRGGRYYYRNGRWR